MNDVIMDRINARHNGLHRGPLLRAWAAGDVDFVRGFISGRFEVDVSRDEVVSWLPLLCMNRCACWSDCTLLMWVKNRLAGRFQIGFASADVADLKTEMHTFFLYCEETEAMMSALRAGESEQQRDARVARSKISSSTLSSIEPVNRVAERVCHEDASQ